MSSKPTPIRSIASFEVLSRSFGAVLPRPVRSRSILVLSVALGLGALALGGLRHQFSAGFMNFQGCAGDTVAAATVHQQAVAPRLA